MESILIYANGLYMTQNEDLMYVNVEYVICQDCDT